MNQREQLRRQIEEERGRLNRMLEDEDRAADAYVQSTVVDRLIEQYLDSE